MPIKKPHILIIDDDHLFCTIIGEILNRAGFISTTAFDGRKGLKLLNENSHLYDVIILDRNMPNFNGLDVLHKLCLIPHVRDIPVIMLTAYAEKGHVEAAIRYGVFDVIYKPVDEARLISMIKKALKEKAEKIII